MDIYESNNKLLFKQLATNTTWLQNQANLMRWHLRNHWNIYQQEYKYIFVLKLTYFNAVQLQDIVHPHMLNIK